MFNLSFFSFPDCKTHVAFYLPVYREVVSRNHRAGRAGRTHPPQHLQLHEGGHGAAGLFLLKLSYLCTAGELSCVTLFSSQAVSWKAGCVLRPSPGLLSRGLSASVHCGVSASPGPSVGPSATRSPTTVTFVQFPPSVVLERGFALETH